MTQEGKIGRTPAVEARPTRTLVAIQTRDSTPIPTQQAQAEGEGVLDDQQEKAKQILEQDQKEDHMHKGCNQHPLVLLLHHL